MFSLEHTLAWYTGIAAIGLFRIWLYSILQIALSVNFFKLRIFHPSKGLALSVFVAMSFASLGRCYTSKGFIVISFVINVAFYIFTNWKESIIYSSFLNLSKLFLDVKELIKHIILQLTCKTCSIINMHRK